MSESISIVGDYQPLWRGPSIEVRGAGDGAMSESMVERVARALCRVDGNPENATMDGKPLWQDYLPEARAAIEAMMEPTDEMVDAMQEARNQQAHTVRDLAVMPWKAGITEALGKGD